MINQIITLFKSFIYDPNDPVKNCPVYKDIDHGSCAHVDGYLCDYPNCSILKKYLDSTNN